MFTPPRLVAFCLAAACTAVQAAPAPVTLTIDLKAAGPTIPPDFLGLSFESSNLLPQPDGAHLFGPANQPLITLFRTLGIRSLRVGGSTVDMPRYAVPGEKDADELFAFAKAADVKIIYSLRLPRANIDTDTAIAKYVFQQYQTRLTCFEIGNEPDFYRRVYLEIPDYPIYRGLWKAIADEVVKAAPGAKFCGTAAGGTSAWSRSFARDFARTGFIAAVVQHEYPGGDGNVTGGAPAREAMMSRAWLELYDRLYTSFATTTQSLGLHYRLEETNNFTGGAKDATDTFTASLWALDYLHWWAAHGASGLNFHNRRWILNTTIYPADSSDGLKGGYKIHPVAYGLKAFSLASHGAVVPVAITNPEAVNLTAYAVLDGSSLLVTVINKKDPGAKPRDVSVKIVAPGAGAPTSAINLAAPGNDLAAKEGITLGGVSIDAGTWDGKWTPLADSAKDDITIPGASAAIIKLPLHN